jgi:hypothetical protein
MPEYAVGKGKPAAPAAAEPAFSREEMLSTENSPILKELMQ